MQGDQRLNGTSPVGQEYTGRSQGHHGLQTLSQVSSWTLITFLPPWPTPDRNKVRKQMGTFASMKQSAYSTCVMGQMKLVWLESQSYLHQLPSVLSASLSGWRPSRGGKRKLVSLVALTPRTGRDGRKEADRIFRVFGVHPCARRWDAY